jgi:hypothetical protein
MAHSSYQKLTVLKDVVEGEPFEWIMDFQGLHGNN